MPYDGVGRDVRNGLNFVERGYGVRAALGCSDRGHSAAAAMRPGDVDWDAIFGTDGARWFHCGGIFAALSPGAAALALEAMAAARRHGTIVSFDLNYRPSLWKAIGGPEAAAADEPRARRAGRRPASATRRTSPRRSDTRSKASTSRIVDLDVAAYEQLHRRVLADYPNLALVATSLREAQTATVNDWSAVCSSRDAFVVGPAMRGLEILDRVGGGDSFASGLDLRPARRTPISTRHSRTASPTVRSR